MGLAEFVQARIDEQAAIWAAAAEVAENETEAYLCRDALGKLNVRRILANGGLGLAGLAEQYADHPDYALVAA